MKKLNEEIEINKSNIERYQQMLDTISDTNTDFTINFDSTVSGVNNSRIDGSGLQSTPSSGQLDSDAWKMLRGIRKILRIRR